MLRSVVQPFLLFFNQEVVMESFPLVRERFYPAWVMALAAAELLDQPETLAAARRELNVKTGGAYHCPIPPEVGPTL